MYPTRKGTAVINIFTDEYNYDLDMQVKAEEAFDKGAQEGAQQKAINDAITLIKKYKVTPEEASKDMNAPLELVLERLEQEAEK